MRISSSIGLWVLAVLFVSFTGSNHAQHPQSEAEIVLIQSDFWKRQAGRGWSPPQRDTLYFVMAVRDADGWRLEEGWPCERLLGACKEYFDNCDKFLIQKNAQ